ncbi:MULTISPECIES: S-layer homology domain-containing protein [unclassified Fusibacter]|uniref:S-layer homology domain-containing protein n=1 Tax=unclassified Fusibacter TaxID=2624464 RepID=UPI00101263BB|nr:MULTISPECIES: S-layer homology domain-containing protein [unclassified Fusibacter]MCK8059894.1 S-layer homology domain-containing protein [Fusibacter sp. A2]NPE21696.1 S-layer homology domain-containing protein [Fusibacter sp. A1]RXV62099.1 S-layer homology domain-containing protein [Fusibacter sp. A1]
MKKLIALMLVVLMFTNMAFAVGFTDLNDASWAEEYITRMADLGIVTGYSDGTYKPLDQVSKYAAVVVIYRTLDAQGLIDKNEVEVLKNRYASALTSYSVPAWPNLHEAVAYFIENKILAATDLSGFMKDGVHQDISREDMSKYLGKALNLFLKEDTNQIISLPTIKDVTAISFESLKYVYILNKHAIVSGDSNGYFNPTAPLNRAALAKMLSTSIDVLAKENAVVDKVINATVYVKLDDTRKIVFYEVGSTTSSYIEKIDDTVEVVIGSEPAGYSDITLDMIVQLTYKNDKLVKVTSDNVERKLTEVTGEVTNIASLSGNSYIYVKNDVTGAIEFYTVDKDIVVTSGGEAAQYDGMVVGDQVTLGISEKVAYTMDFETKYQTLKGVIKSIVVDGEPKVLITIGSGDKLFTVSDTVKITRNEKVKTIGALLVGDEVVVEATFDELTKITATGVIGKENGVISSVTIGDTYQIVIRDVNGNENTYTIDESAKVTIDGQVKSYFDLRTNYTVSAVVESAVISELTATSKVAKNYIVGYVETVYTELSVLIVNVDGVSYTVNTNASTIMLSSSGIKQSFTGFKVDQTVFVYGVREDKIILAEKLMRLE